MRILVAISLLSLVVPSAAQAGPSGDVVISIRQSGAILVPVQVNGYGPFMFLLDTGASHTVIDSDMVERLGLPIVAKALVSTTAGPETRPVVQVEVASIGSASVDGLQPSVVPLRQLREVESGIVGLIGQDFLSRFNYTVDYRRHRLRWTVHDSDGDVRLPLVRAEGRSLVQLSSGSRDSPVWMVPDSGAEALVVFERGGRTGVEIEWTDWPVGASAVAMTRTGRLAVLRQLKVGPVTLRDQPAVVLSGAGSKATEGDGLMPLHFFSSVAFNNKEGWMAVTPLPGPGPKWKVPDMLMQRRTAR